MYVSAFNHITTINYLLSTVMETAISPKPENHPARNTPHLSMPRQHRHPPPPSLSLAASARALHFGFLPARQLVLVLVLTLVLGGRVAEWYWMGRQRPYGCGFESRAPHREGGHVTVMLRGVLIGWFDPGWQVFHLS